MLSGRILGFGLITRPVGPTECGVNDYDLKASIIRRSWPTRGCRVIENSVKLIVPNYEASQ